MDVHAPDHPIHTKRDFFIHLFTITVGLLIALSLEGLVEYFHHRHIVHEARANIRQEIQDNRTVLKQDFVFLQQGIDNQLKNIDTLRELHNHPDPSKVPSLNFGLGFSPPEDAAWTTARETGALNYMPYEVVEDLAKIYRVQSIANTQSMDLFHETEIGAGPAFTQNSLKDLPPADIDALIHSAAAIRLQLLSLQKILTMLDDIYQDELKRL